MKLKILCLFRHKWEYVFKLIPKGYAAIRGCSRCGKGQVRYPGFGHWTDAEGWTWDKMLKVFEREAERNAY